MSATERQQRHPRKIRIYRAPESTGQPDPAVSFEAEYRKMLAYRSLADLQAIARARGVDLTSDDRSVLIAVLARRLSDQADTRTEVLHTDPPSQAILAYLHLTLTPGHALSAENLIRELSTTYQDGFITWFQRDTRPRKIVPVPSEPADSSSRWDMELESMVRAAAPANMPTGMRLDFRQAYAQIAALTQRGLLFCFKQNNATYYSLPLAVRASLPVLPGLVPLCAANKTASLQVQTRSPSALIQRLFAVWQAMDAATGERDARHGTGDRTQADVRGCTHPPGSNGPFVRSDAPPRQPAEDEWPPFQGWDHVPSEIADLTHVRQWYVRPGSYGERRTLLNPLNQAVTIPVPGYRLRSADRAFLRRKTMCTDEELEFYCALLEGIDALSAEPGQPIVTHPSAMQRLLSSTSADQVTTIGQAWLNTLAWSEIDIVLRSQSQPESDAGAVPPTEPMLRLRRSLTHVDYKAADLYQEWRAGRQAVFRFLSVLEEGRWFSIAGFLHTLFQVNPNLFHSYSAASVWWLESTRTRKQFGTTFDDWQQGYGQCLLAMLQGPMTWLGIVSLGTVDGQPQAMKLTHVGQFLVGRQPTLRDEPDSAASCQRMYPSSAICTFGDDLTISLVPNRVPSQLHHLLGSIGPLEQVTPQRFVYRVTAEGLRQWQESLWVTKEGTSARAPVAAQTRPDSESLPDGRIGTLISLLQQLLHTVDSRIDLPAAWQDKLSRWSQNYGLLHVYEDITVIELADEYALQELLACTSLREHIIYQFSPYLIAIRPDRVDALVREMEGRGYTPRLR
jgi:hypothetical protein